MAAIAIPKDVISEDSTLLYKYPVPSYMYNDNTGIIKLYNNIPARYGPGWEGLCIVTGCKGDNNNWGEPKPIVRWVPFGIQSHMYVVPEKPRLTRLEVIAVLKKVLQQSRGSLELHQSTRLLCLDKEAHRLVTKKLEELLDEEASARARLHLVNLIYTAWYAAESNPYHKLCKKRLLREWEELACNT